MSDAPEYATKQELRDWVQVMHAKAQEHKKLIEQLQSDLESLEERLLCDDF